jgi:hypothetical protein
MRYLISLFAPRPLHRSFALLDRNGRCQAFKQCNPPDLAEPAAARQRPGHTATNARTGSGAVEHLTGCLIKVIKHEQLRAFLRYNLPPIIRTSPDRAPQQRQCACIDIKIAHREPPTQIE